MGQMRCLRKRRSRAEEEQGDEAEPACGVWDPSEPG